MGKFLSANGSRLTEMREASNTLIMLLTNVITSKRLTEKKITDLQYMLNLFICAIFDVNFRGRWRVELLTDILTALVKVPVENGISKKRTLELYERLDIVNTVTFLIFQTRQITFSKRLIMNFLEYLQGDKEYNYYALLFYRVNPQFIANILTLSITDATPKELYFGISTGYFPYMEGMSESYSRLVKMVKEYSDGANDLRNSGVSGYSSNPSDLDKSGNSDVLGAGMENTGFGINKSHSVAAFDYTISSVLRLLNKDGFLKKETFLMLISLL